MGAAALRTGDILIFEAGQDFMGRAIALLTDSSVSHAALLYAADEIVGMGQMGIETFPFTIVAPGEPGEGARLMHVRRMDDEPDPTPLVAAAKAYLDQKLVYDMPLLVMLGGILVYRKLRYTSAIWPFVKPILLAAVAALDGWLSERKDRPAQVCSQFVQQCYLDAGYVIEFENGILQGARGLRLIDSLRSAPVEALWPSAKALGGAPLDDAFWEDFCQALSMPSEDSALSLEPPHDVLPVASAFAELARLLVLETGTPIQAMFVTPADLLCHTTNLMDIGSMRIRRN